MSGAAEKLKAQAVRQNLGGSSGPYDVWEDTTAYALLAALPQIVAVVEAAEDERGLLLSSEPTGTEMVGWPVDKAQKLQAALAALDEALGDVT